MSDIDPVAAVAASVQTARRLVALTLFIVAIAVVVLWIDQGIKRSVIDEAQRMRYLLDELKTITREAAYAAGAGEVPAGSSDGADLAGHVDDAAGAPTQAAGDESNGTRAAGSRARRPAGGTRGDG